MGWGDGKLYDHLTCDRCGHERPYLGHTSPVGLSVSRTRLVSEARGNAGWIIGKRALDSRQIF